MADEEGAQRSQNNDPKPVGKPSQAEGEGDGEKHEVKPQLGKPSQAEGDVGDSDAPQQ